MPENTSNYHLNLELIVTHPVMESVKNYDINVPEICITAILREIERVETINSAVAVTTASKEVEIQHLKQELRVIRERWEKAEAALKKHRFWER